MDNITQHHYWISRMPAVAASTALAFSGVLMLAAITTQSAQAQTFTTLASFDGTNGSAPYAPLVQATNGKLYGTTNQDGSYGEGTVFEITPSGTLRTLYNFCPQSGCKDGAFPFAALVQATNGICTGQQPAAGPTATMARFSKSP